MTQAFEGDSGRSFRIIKNHILQIYSHQCAQSAMLADSSIAQLRMRLFRALTKSIEFSMYVR